MSEENKDKREHSTLSYWLDKAGAAGILLGPAETAAQLAVSGEYTGPSQLVPGMGALTVGLTAWNTAKYIKEHNEGKKRSPIVHLGRALEVLGTSYTEGGLLSGNVDNIYGAFFPAASGISFGAFLEYVAGPVHEMFSKKYK